MEIRKFLGLRNVTSAERLRPGHLDVAENVDLDDTGKVLSRLGTSVAIAGSYHSLWADGDMCLLVSGQDLKRVNSDYSLTQVLRLGTARRVAYSRQGGTVYYSNGVDKGRIAQGAPGEWGIRPPVGQPVASATGGNLPAGRYQYALTFRRADRSESGTGIAGMVELSSPGGISFSSIESSSDAEVTSKCLYLSGPDGTELFRLAELANGDSVFSYRGSGSELSIRLETQFDNPPPAGDILEYYNGVMFAAVGNLVFHSKPYQLERFCFRDQWLQFPGAVTMFAAVNDGVYVSAGDSTWFLAGDGPGKFESHLVFDHAAIPGTAVKTTVGELKDKDEASEGTPAGSAVFWTSPKGICMGADGGQALNMTETDYSLPGAARGAGLIRQARGYSQYLVSLEGTQSAPSDAY